MKGWFDWPTEFQSREAAKGESIQGKVDVLTQVPVMWLVRVVGMTGWLTGPTEFQLREAVKGKSMQ